MLGYTHPQKQTHPPGPDPPGADPPSGSKKPPPGADTPQEQTPPPLGVDPPGTDTSPRYSVSWEIQIRVTSGQYTSYWNAILVRIVPGHQYLTLIRNDGI